MLQPRRHFGSRFHFEDFSWRCSFAASISDSAASEASRQRLQQQLQFEQQRCRRSWIRPSFDDPSGTGNPPEGTSVHRKLPKPKRVQSDDERVDEDLNVAKFYMRDENYQGAYLRAKDAVKVQPEYSAAHFALAETAQKLKKKDEAIAEYEAYLKMDPDGEKAKAAKSALADLKK